MNCKKCNVPMISGKAIEQTWSGSPDFSGQDGTEPGCTMSPGGPGKLVDCLKCPQCGYSVYPVEKFRPIVHKEYLKP